MRKGRQRKRTDTKWRKEKGKVLGRGQKRLEVRKRDETERSGEKKRDKGTKLIKRTNSEENQAEDGG